MINRKLNERKREKKEINIMRKRKYEWEYFEEKRGRKRIRLLSAKQKRKKKNATKFFQKEGNECENLEERKLNEWKKRMKWKKIYRRS